MSEHHDSLAHAVANKSVGVLLLGRFFRTGVGGEYDMPCLRSSEAEQREATTSWLHHVIRPLEARGAAVRVFYAATRCANPAVGKRLRRLIDTWLKPRAPTSWLVDSASISDNWAQAYAGLARRGGDELDFLLHGRHDFAVTMPINRWPVRPSWHSMLFEQYCRQCGSQPYAECKLGPGHHCLAGQRDGDACMADAILWTPASHMRLLKDAVASWDNGGHGFIQAVYSRLRLARTDYPPRSSGLGFAFPSDGDLSPAEECSAGRACFVHNSYRPERRSNSRPNTTLLELNPDWAMEWRAAQVRQAAHGR